MALAPHTAEKLLKNNEILYQRLKLPLNNNSLLAGININYYGYRSVNMETSTRKNRKLFMQPQISHENEVTASV